MSSSKKLLLLIFSSILFSFPLLAEDIVILRNGEELHGKLDLISDKEIVFTLKSGTIFKGSTERRSLPTLNVYMVRTDKRGTIFYNREGVRTISPTTKVERSADIIYLVDGGEIAAWNISLANGIINYQKNPKAKRAMSNIGAIPTEDVFMVKYSDGSKDIFTNINNMGHESQKKVNKDDEITIKVIIYNVVAGDTLTKISEKYNVKIDDIKEWNDLSSKYGATTKLSPGTQLILQIPTK